MKTIYKLSPLAIAIVALGFSAPVFAGNYGDDGGAHITDHSHSSYDMDLDGHIKVRGYVEVKSAAKATSNTDQKTGDNTVANSWGSKNSATAGTNNLDNGSNGNIGVNVSNGAGNQQANTASIASSNATFSYDKDAGGSADSEVFSNQGNGDNSVYNHTATNQADMGSNVLNGAHGNIGVNIANGAGNQQGNSLAVSSVANSVLANASVSASQHNGDNFVDNDSFFCPTSNTATLGNNVLNGAYGNIGVNVANGAGNQQMNGLSIASVTSTAP
ncbi:MAG TPA: hypothetical protein VND43_04680 [Burkholderiales bacterium]|nr:hypothetical protein [Burkholderiales bacterium]